MILLCLVPASVVEIKLVAIVDVGLVGVVHLLLVVASSLRGHFPATVAVVVISNLRP